MSESIPHEPAAIKLNPFTDTRVSFDKKSGSLLEPQMREILGRKVSVIREWLVANGDSPTAEALESISQTGRVSIDERFWFAEEDFPKTESDQSRFFLYAEEYDLSLRARTSISLGFDGNYQVEVGYEGVKSSSKNYSSGNPKPVDKISDREAIMLNKVFSNFIADRKIAFSSPNDIVTSGTDSFPEEANDEQSESRIKVDMDETGLIYEDQEGETTGLGPCLGLVIFDHPGKRAFLGHLPTPEHYIDQEFDKYLNGLSSVPELMVFLGGMGNFDRPGDQGTTIREDLGEARAVVIDTLKKRGFTDDQIKAEWPVENALDTATVMRVIPSKDIVEYDIMDVRTRERKVITLSATNQSAKKST